jgi:hypothetical protein
MSIIIPDPALTDWVPMSYGASIQTNVPACRVYRTTVQLIPTSTNTIIGFDAERYDTDNIHDNVTNNTRLTCRTAGKYLITANLGFGTTAAGTRQLSIYLNGATYLGLVSQPSNTGVDGPYMHVSCVQDLIVGDYVEVLVYQTSGAGLNVLAASGQQYTPEFSMTYIGPGLIGRGITNLTGTYLNRPAANTVPQGSTYFATDTLGTWLSDGLAWTLVQQRAPMITSATMSAAPFTTPYDGQEIILTDSLTAPTYDWRFRYNAGSGSAYKWEFIGGTQPLLATAIGAYEAIPGTAVFGDCATLTRFVVPRAGDYEAITFGQFSANAAGVLMQMGIVSNTGVSGAATAVALTLAGNAYHAPMTHSDRIPGIAAGGDIRARYYTSPAGGLVANRWIRAWPVRVS